MLFLNVNIKNRKKACKGRKSIILAFWRCIKGVLKICCKYTGEHPCRRAISIKLLCNLQKIPENQVCWVEEKRKDVHDETKLHLNREWTIVILELFVVNYFSSSYRYFSQNGRVVTFSYYRTLNKVFYL